ncbi:MAG: uroporphyrinogen decarboxylase family protein [Planctomycetota bacterium]|jgi:hypothetical protein|nr:uroporphyrinogen decarboxylase family protein [Planctomycetota bacterium]MDP7132544.1 uroporphyrinogen decarboxylase family protein [Planctomycetota bacterium]
MQSVLNRHSAFWQMEDVSQPLMSVGEYHPLQSRRPLQLSNGLEIEQNTELRPDRLDTEYFTGLSGSPDNAFQGDFIRGSTPYDICWTEAIIGCPIVWKAGYPWSEPISECLDDLTILEINEDNPWLAKLLDVTKCLAEKSNGRYPVCQPLMRGPIDLATAALGDEPTVYAIADQPAKLRELLEECTTAFIDIASAFQETSGLFQGGVVEYGIHAPGPGIRTQADNAALMSPRSYRELLRPCDERVCEAFEYTLIHTHSACLRVMTDSLLDIKKLRAIQVSLDYPGATSVADVMPFLKEMNEHKPLVLTGPVTQAELDELLDTLSPRGLCLLLGLRED